MTPSLTIGGSVHARWNGDEEEAIACHLLTLVKEARWSGAGKSGATKSSVALGREVSEDLGHRAMEVLEPTPGVDLGQERRPRRRQRPESAGKHAVLDP